MIRVKENIVFYLINLLVFIFPINQKIATILAVCLSFFWLTEPFLIQRLKNGFKDKYTILCISFYVLHCLGLLYTSNLKEGGFDL